MRSAKHDLAYEWAPTPVVQDDAVAAWLEAAARSVPALLLRLLLAHLRWARHLLGLFAQTLCASLARPTAIVSEGH